MNECKYYFITYGYKAKGNRGKGKGKVVIKVTKGRVIDNRYLIDHILYELNKTIDPKATSGRITSIREICEDEFNLNQDLYLSI